MISAATRESRYIYFKTFSEHNKIQKGIIRYPPGTIIYIDSLGAIVRPRFDKNRLLTLRDHPDMNLPSLRDVFEAWQFFGKVDHVACRVVEIYNITRLQVAQSEQAGPLYPFTRMDIKSLSILGTRHGWEWVELRRLDFDEDCLGDEAKADAVEYLLTTARKAFENIKRRSGWQLIIPEMKAVVESCQSSQEPFQLTPPEVTRKLYHWKMELQNGWRI